MSSIIDPDPIELSWKHRPLYGPNQVHVQTRQRLLSFLERGRYKEALVLLQAMLETNKYDVESYWKVGVELVENNFPEHVTDFLYAASISARGEASVPIFVAWVQRLLKEQRYEKALEEVESRMMQRRFSSNLELAKIRALLIYRQWKQVQQGVERRPATNVLKTLEEVHNRDTRDVRILDAYLSVMATINQGAIDQYARNVFTSHTASTDLEWTSILLRAWSEKTDDVWVTVAMEVCETDPSADPRVLMATLTKALRAKCSQERNLVKNVDALIMLFQLFFDRLEFGIADEWTLQELTRCVQLYQHAISHKPMLRVHMYACVDDEEMIKKIDTLMDCYANNESAVEVISQFRSVFVDLRNKRQRNASMSTATLDVNMAMAANPKTITEMTVHDPWRDYLGF